MNDWELWNIQVHDGRKESSEKRRNSTYLSKNHECKMMDSPKMAYETFMFPLLNTTTF
jgi:hypothetical protein